MPMSVYITVNHFRVSNPNPEDKYPFYRVVLQVGNGADVIATFQPRVFDEFVDALVKAREETKHKSPYDDAVENPEKYAGFKEYGGQP